MAIYPDVKDGVVGSHPNRVRYYDSDPHNSRSQTIVLLHGTGGSAEGNFWALYPMLAMRHRVIAFDFSDPEAGGGTTDHKFFDSAGAGYVEQAAAVIAEVAAGGPVHLVGYSFGSVIATMLAARRPELIETLTLIAGWCKTDAQQLLRNDVWWSLHEDDHVAAASFSVFTQYSPQFLNARTPIELQNLIKAVQEGPDRSVKMRFNRLVDVTDELGRIVAPTLVVGCTHDQMVPMRHSQLLFGGIEDARLAEVDSGHGVVHERPAELFVLIDAFVRDPKTTTPGTVLERTHS